MEACVLVVDDDREIVQAIALLLEKEGYRVLRAYNGLEALELACERSVQLSILLDVMMPRLDGLSALMKIREKRNLPIIVLSAKSEDSDKILGLSMGADDYVSKPSIPGAAGPGPQSAAAVYPAGGCPCGRAERERLLNGRLTYLPEALELRVDGEPVRLTATETRIVDLLMRIWTDLSG